MTWMNFFTFCGIGYAAYYCVLFLTDSSSPLGSTGEEGSPVLTFSEEEIPEKISLADIGLNGSSGGGGTSLPAASVGLGGVSIKELFVLAQKDAIQFTRSVSF